MPAGRPGAHLDPQYAATDSEAADLAPTAAITHDADTGAIGLQTVGNTSSKKCYSCFKTQSRMALDKSLLPLPENVKGTSADACGKDWTYQCAASSPACCDRL